MMAKKYNQPEQSPLKTAAAKYGYSKYKNTPLSNTDEEIGVPYRSRLTEKDYNKASKLGILGSESDQDTAKASGSEQAKTENKAEKPKFKKGGSIRGHGCETKGKTKGRMV
jgi:hypothetical protein